MAKDLDLAGKAFAQPEYDAWWRFWEEEGWVSLGRTKNYVLDARAGGEALGGP
jgi:hypothetical protein